MATARTFAATGRCLSDDDTKVPTSATFLIGFAGVANWRALEFVNALPPMRLCHLCGVVPDTTYVLECSHGFCKFCYDRILAKGRTCPLDQERFDENDTGNIVFKQNQLTKLKSRCPNTKHGCDFVGDVFQTFDHFLTLCVFHEVACPRCNERVVRNDILAHVTDGCRRAAQAIKPPPKQDNLLMKNMMKVSNEIQWELESMNNVQHSVQDSLNRLTTEIGASTVELKQLIAASDSKNALQQLNQSVDLQLGRVSKACEEMKRGFERKLRDAIVEVRAAHASTARQNDAALIQSGSSSSAAKHRVLRTILRKVNGDQAEKYSWVKSLFLSDSVVIGEFAAFFICIFTDSTNYIYLVQQPASNISGNSLCDVVHTLNVVHPNKGTVSIKIQMEQLVSSRHWLPYKIYNIPQGSCVVSSANFVSVPELKRLGFIPDDTLSIDIIP